MIATLRDIKEYELLNQKIYKVLKEKIVKGFIKPGSSLISTAIANDLNVSKTPVREALSKLASDGLLMVSPNKSMIVLDVSIEKVIEVLQVRGVLEGLAARITANNISELEVKKLEKTIKQMSLAVKLNNIENYCKYDDNFHKLILKICNNQTLIEIRKSLGNIIYRFRVKSLSVKGRLNNSLYEHRKIFESIKAHDLFSAEKYSIQHMENTITNLKNILK